MELILLLTFDSGRNLANYLRKGLKDWHLQDRQPLRVVQMENGWVVLIMIIEVERLLRENKSDATRICRLHLELMVDVKMITNIRQTVKYVLSTGRLNYRHDKQPLVSVDDHNLAKVQTILRNPAR